MNCPYCGHKLLEPVGRNCTNCGKVIPGVGQPDTYLDTLERANQSSKGISDLKNAYLLYFIGGILSLVPVVGALGALVGFIGLILLIIGWRALGRSSLHNARSYKSTGSWLVYAIVILIVLGIIGIVVITSSALGNLFSNPSLFRANGTSSSVLQSAAYHQFVAQFTSQLFVFLFILDGIWISVWIKMLLSLKKLGSELSERRIVQGANASIAQVVFGLLGGSFTVYATFQTIFANISSPSSPSNFSRGLFFAPYSYLLLGGFWPWVLVVSVVGSVLIIVGSYLVYTGLGKGLHKLPPPSPPSPPSPLSGSSQFSFCPQCGTHIDDTTTNFCPSSGLKLRD